MVVLDVRSRYLRYFSIRPFDDLSTPFKGSFFSIRCIELQLVPHSHIVNSPYSSVRVSLNRIQRIQVSYVISRVNESYFDREQAVVTNGVL